MELCVEFDSVKNDSWVTGDSPFLEMICTLDVMMVNDGKIVKIRSSVFKEMDSPVRYAVMIDQILTEKLQLLNIRLEDDLVVDIVNSLVDGYSDGQGVAIDLAKYTV